MQLFYNLSLSLTESWSWGEACPPLLYTILTILLVNVESSTCTPSHAEDYVEYKVCKTKHSRSGGLLGSTITSRIDFDTIL